MLRIVHCFRSPVGGIFRHVRDLCDAQAAAGHKVGIVCDSNTGGAYEDALFREMEETLALGLQRLPMERSVGLRDIGAAGRVFGALRAMKPDVLHGHGAKGGVYARLSGTLMRLSGHRVARIYSPHGGSLHYDPATLSGGVYFLFERLLDRLSDHILFVSDYERRMYRQKVGGPHAPSSLVYNGLRAGEFEPVTPAGDAADFLYIGMMRDLKGPDIFIDALAAAEKSLGRRLSAVMVGDGDGLDRYKAQAQELGLSARIRFLPAMTARKAFGLARIVVVPSRAEAMPYIVLEAFAAGRTVIASSVGGIPEIFAEHTRGLVEPDVQSVAERMAQALSHEAAFAASMPGKDTLKARFGADVMARDIETAYRRALAPDGKTTGQRTTSAAKSRES